MDMVHGVFDNGFVGNVVIFGIGYGLRRKPENINNNFLVLSEGATDDTNDSVNVPEKSIDLFFLNQTQSFVRVFIIMVVIALYM